MELSRNEDQDDENARRHGMTTAHLGRALWSTATPSSPDEHRAWTDESATYDALMEDIDRILAEDAELSEP
jgi:hypothetical protein